MLLLVGLIACGGNEAIDDSATTPTDSSADTDTDTDTIIDTAVLGACPPNGVPIGVEDASYVWSEDHTYDYEPPSAITATDLGGGKVDVFHDLAWLECCPELVVGACSTDDGRIVVHYANADDWQCDCITWLDISYTLTGVPPGTWTITDGTTSGSVTVQ